MKRYWTPRAIAYLVLGIIGLIGTWTFNGLAIAQARNYLGDWVGSGPSVSSLTVDLLVVAIAGSVFIILESRRLGIRGGWVYVALSVLTAFAFTFPVFLAVRERALERARVSAAGRSARDGASIPPDDRSQLSGGNP